MANRVTGTCVITRLRNGDTLYAVLDVSGTPCIFYDESRIITDFSSDNVTFKGSVQSMLNADVEITSAVWKVNGAVISSNAVYEVSNTELKVKGNPITHPADITNLTIEWTPTVKSQGSTQQITKITEITAVKQGANSYWGTIQAKSSTILSANHTSVTLGQSLVLGGNDVDDYTVKWYVDGVLKGSGNTLTVTRDDVSGMAYVSCEFFVDGTFVEADGITIADIADELQIILNEHYSVAYGGDITITPQLAKINPSGGIEYIPKSDVAWSVTVRNNYTLEVIPATDYTFSEDGGIFTMSENKMYTKDNPPQEYSPVVIFTATV